MTRVEYFPGPVRDSGLPVYLCEILESVKLPFFENTEKSRFEIYKSSRDHGIPEISRD